MTCHVPEHGGLPPAAEVVRASLYAELSEIECYLRGLRSLHQSLLARRGDTLFALRDMGEPVTEIAARLGVSRGTIDKTLRNHKPGARRPPSDED